MCFIHRKNRELVTTVEKIDFVLCIVIHFVTFIDHECCLWLPLGPIIFNFLSTVIMLGLFSFFVVVVKIFEGESTRKNQWDTND